MMDPLETPYVCALSILLPAPCRQLLTSYRGFYSLYLSIYLAVHF